MGKTNFDKLRINLFIAGTASKEGAGGYAVLMQSTIKERDYKKLIGGYARETSVTRMALKSLVEGLSSIKSKSFIHIHTSIPQVSAGLNRNMYIWEKKNWKRKNGEQLMHEDLWKQVFNLLEEKALGYKVHPQNKTGENKNYWTAVSTASEYLSTARRNLYEVSI